MPKKGKGHRAQAAGKSRDELERKRDERARRSAFKKERGIKEYLENDENFVSFSNQLQAIGYKIKDIKGDGNCLFRALSDQLDGDDSGHVRHRRIIAQYIADHRDEFEPFVEDNKSFDHHVKELRKPGTYGGNDSIVAFSRNHGVNIVIHQLNEPCWVIQGAQYKNSLPSRSGLTKELHISYHNGDHYSSVRRIGDPDNGPAWQFNNKNIKVKDDEYCKSKAKRKELQCEAAEALPVGSSELVIIQAATGCEDTALIQQTLIESNYDLDAAISYILQLQLVVDVADTSVPLDISPVEIPVVCNGYTDSVEQENHGGGSNKSNSTPGVPSMSTKPHSMPKGGARPKVKQQEHNLSNSKRKQLAKQEKKARRMDEQREEAQRKSKQDIVVNDQPLQLAGDIEALAI